jgi:hypothetical protein
MRNAFTLSRLSTESRDFLTGAFLDFSKTWVKLQVIMRHRDRELPKLEDFFDVRWKLEPISFCVNFCQKLKIFQKHQIPLYPQKAISSVFPAMERPS